MTSRGRVCFLSGTSGFPADCAAPGPTALKEISALRYGVFSPRRLYSETLTGLAALGVSGSTTRIENCLVDRTFVALKYVRNPKAWSPSTCSRNFSQSPLLIYVSRLTCNQLQRLISRGFAPFGKAKLFRLSA
jgi:hypothetical protein